jgi:hypothetical protein
LEGETAAYYESLSVSEREADASWAAASSQAFRRLTIDDHVRRKSKKGRAPRTRRGRRA